MFERFTDRARRVIVVAQDESRALSHNYIGTEHLLLALIKEGNSAVRQIIADAGLTPEIAIEKMVLQRGEMAPSGHIPFTPRAKKVLEMSLREALQRGHNYIGTEHLFLALIREGDGTAAQCLVNQGLDYRKAFKLVSTAIGEGVAATAYIPPLPMIPPDEKTSVPLVTTKLSEVTDLESPRAEVLIEAKRLITGDRNKSYGSPTSNFQNTAEMWTTRLKHKLQDGETITALDVADLMVLLKVARSIAQPKRDTYVDIAGYAACGAEAAIELGLM